MDESRRLYRSKDDQMIAGVCAGIGEYFGIDPTLVRLAAVVLLVVGNFATFVAYIAMAALVPVEGEEYPASDAAASDAQASPPLGGVDYAASEAGGDSAQTGTEEAGADVAAASPGIDRGAAVAGEPEQHGVGAMPASPPPPSSQPAQDQPPHGPHAGSVRSDARPARSAGTSVALILIVVGSVLLAAQLIPGLDWWRLWPLVIVLAGMVQAVTPGRDGWTVHRFFDGLVTVAFGLVFLAVTTGVVGWGVWMHILSLWPVLLIALGFELLGKSLQTSWLRVLGSLAIIGALAFGVATAAGGLRQPMLLGTTRGEQVSLSQQATGVEEASLRMRAGLANISIGGSDRLVEVDGYSGLGRPELQVERSGRSADVELRLGDGQFMRPWGTSFESRLDVGVSSRVMWDADIEAGAASVRADFSDVNLRSLELRPGVAECEVRLGPVPRGVDEARATVRAGVASVRILVPDNAEVRLEGTGGISSTTAGGRLERVERGVWETPGFSDARRRGEPVWVVRSETGVGAFRIDSY